LEFEGELRKKIIMENADSYKERRYPFRSGTEVFSALGLKWQGF
jgi:hypothetical protein